MEGHGRTAGPEGSQTESIAERTGSGGETGLEQPIWQLGLGGGGGEAYPERPGLADCIYYLRTGFCGYGPRCRFSHPRDRSAVLNALQAAGADYPERVGQPICQYYMRTGMCKFGASCKFHHPRQGIGSVSQVSYNYYGYPLRPGEKECSYYVKTGKCKFGVTCKFHHPQLAGVQMPLPAPAPGVAALASHVPGPALYPSVQSSSQQFGVVAGNWQVARPPMATGSLLQGSYGGLLLPPGMVHLAGWSPYSAPISPVPPPSVQPAVGSGQFYGITQLSPSAPVYTGGYPPMPASVGPSSSGQAEQNFPERPGQPECQYYLKTGDCKFGSSCKYHHPRELATAKSNYILSPMNLPLRPGAAPCSYYAQHGVCKFGPTCKFDHPMGGALSLSYSPSASSLADMPVAPFPVGSSIGTLAPSFSSSDSQPELLPGPGKDSSSSTRMSSSTRAMSGSVGSMLSRNGSAPHVDARPSGQVSDPSSGSSSMEARSS